MRYSKKFWTCVGSRVSGDWWWYRARSVKVARYDFWVDAENARHNISRAMRSRHTPMGCLRTEGTRDAHHERHTEDTGTEMGDWTRRGSIRWTSISKGDYEVGCREKEPREAVRSMLPIVRLVTCVLVSGLRYN